MIFFMESRYTIVCGTWMNRRSTEAHDHTLRAFDYIDLRVYILFDFDIHVDYNEHYSSHQCIMCVEFWFSTRRVSRILLKTSLLYTIILYARDKSDTFGIYSSVDNIRRDQFMRRLVGRVGVAYLCWRRRSRRKPDAARRTRNPTGLSTRTTTRDATRWPSFQFYWRGLVI